MSIFDNINERINTMALGDEERADDMPTKTSAAGKFHPPAVASPEVSGLQAANPSAVMKRYKDAYAVAKLANGFGGLTKILGLVLAALIAFIGLIFAAYSAGGSSNSFGASTSSGLGGGIVVFFGFLFWAVFWGVTFYLGGVILSALGQNLMASLDTAVYNSPFLTDEQKAWAMGVQM